MLAGKWQALYDQYSSSIQTLTVGTGV